MSAAVHPRFPSMVGGELMKVSRQWTTWILVLVQLGGLLIVALASLGTPQIKDNLIAHPLTWAYQMLDILQVVFGIGSGIFFLAVSARLVAMEYHHGTIRILLARGIGRLHLLAAQLVALVLCALLFFVFIVAIDAAFVAAVVQGWTGSLNVLHNLPGSYWHDVRLTVVAAWISMGACILVGTAAAVVGRSLAFAIAVAMGLFPADNFGTILLLLMQRITHSDAWLRVSDYLLGPNLNAVAQALEPGRRVNIAFASPAPPWDGNHVLAVVGIYCLAFAVVAIGLTARRDVLE